MPSQLLELVYSVVSLDPARCPSVPRPRGTLGHFFALTKNKFVGLFAIIFWMLVYGKLMHTLLFSTHYSVHLDSYGFYHNLNK